MINKLDQPSKARHVVGSCFKSVALTVRYFSHFLAHSKPQTKRSIRAIVDDDGPIAVFTLPSSALSKLFCEQRVP